MTAAEFAAMADPSKNPQFRRSWTGPPQKRRGPPTAGTVEQPDFPRWTFCRGWHRIAIGVCCGLPAEASPKTDAPLPWA